MIVLGLPGTDASVEDRRVQHDTEFSVSGLLTLEPQAVIRHRWDEFCLCDRQIGFPVCFRVGCQATEKPYVAAEKPKG